MNRKEIGQWLKSGEEADSINEQSKFGEAIIKKVASYNKAQRIVRLIEISVSQDDSAEALLEMSIIQAIREQNGEIEEVLRSRVEED